MTAMDTPFVKGADALWDRLKKNVLRIERDGRAAVILDHALYEELIETYEDLEDIRDAKRAIAHGELETTIFFDELMKDLGLTE